MDDFFTWLNPDKISAVVIIVAVCWAVISDKLVWHTRLEKAEARADKWEDIAWRSISEGGGAGVKAVEVAADVISALPDPSRGRE